MSQAALYAAHLQEQQRRADAALARAGYDHLLIASGREWYAFLDDRAYPLRPNPHFLSWLPLDHHPGCWIAYTPGRRPTLVFHQPQDYWHAAPSAPQGDWVEHFDLQIIGDPDEAAALLPTGRAAILGEPNAAVGAFVPNNPEPVLHYLHYQRARKTAYELSLMRAASLRAARGHLAAAQAFREGASEHAIHLRYCAATEHTDDQLPYSNIIALNEHTAVLHYHHTPGPAPAQSRSFLIDAGAQQRGYASDITRTWAAHPGLYADLIAALDRAQLALVDQMRPGRDYRDLHIDCHRRIAAILRESGIVKLDVDAQVERGISSVFFPHGLGHFLGIQVHDVGGLQRDDTGGTIERPPGHPYLRLTRTLEAGHVLTVEPGLYFIPMLLDRLRASADAACVDWGLVDSLLPYGGIRIEDDVHVTDGVPENLSRDAFAALA